MKLFSKKEEPSSHTILVTIRSASISVSCSTNSESPHLLFSVTQRVTSTVKTTDEFITTFIPIIRKTLQSAVADMAKELAEQGKKLDIKKVHCMITSPWYHTLHRDITVEREETFTLSKKELGDIIGEHVATYTASLPKVTQIEQHITHVILNGYELEDPYKKEAKKITISFVASFIDTAIYIALKQAIQDEVHHKKITFNTYPLVLYATIQNVLITTKNYMAVHVTDQSTECMVVLGGSIAFTAVLPIGNSQMIEAARDTKKDMTRAVAVDMLANYANNVADEQSKKIKVVVEKWALQFVATIRDADVAIPKTIFIDSESSFSGLYNAALQMDAVKEEMYEGATHPHITALSRTSLGKVVHVPDDAAVVHNDICSQTHFVSQEGRL